jgi:hypothetical protein
MGMVPRVVYQQERSGGEVSEGAGIREKRQEETRGDKGRQQTARDCTEARGAPGSS